MTDVTNSDKTFDLNNSYLTEKDLQNIDPKLATIDPNGTISVPSVINKIIYRVEGLHDYSDSVRLFFEDSDKGLEILHMYDCSETVEIIDVVGDVEDLIGAPVVDVSIISSPEHPDFIALLNQNPEAANKPYELNDTKNADEEVSWSFTKIRTTKGEVSLRWLGHSNGWYSEIPAFALFNAEEKNDEYLSFPLPEQKTIDE